MGMPFDTGSHRKRRSDLPDGSLRKEACAIPASLMEPYFRDIHACDAWPVCVRLCPQNYCPLCKQRIKRNCAGIRLRNSICCKQTEVTTGLKYLKRASKKESA